MGRGEARGTGHPGLAARGVDAQLIEAGLACNILNRMTELGRPEFHAIEH